MVTTTTGAWYPDEMGQGIIACILSLKEEDYATMELRIRGIASKTPTTLSILRLTNASEVGRHRFEAKSRAAGALQQLRVLRLDQILEAIGRLTLVETVFCTVF